ncbi:hypothetical protein ACRN9T_20900 [Shewanella baltica]|uniref:hypothetical protein n=1 Tax=Shewanella baltica TaxID=62322 RepID=UPI003D7B6A03
MPELIGLTRVWTFRCYKDRTKFGFQITSNIPITYKWPARFAEPLNKALEQPSAEIVIAEIVIQA